MGEDWQLRYGREKARATVLMQAVAALVRRGVISSDEGKAWIAKADAASANVLLSDFTRIAPLKPRKEGK